MLLITTLETLIMYSPFFLNLNLKKLNCPCMFIKRTHIQNMNNGVWTLYSTSLHSFYMILVKFDNNTQSNIFFKS